MPVESILDAVRAGLAYERVRMDAASRNIAAANVPLAPGAGATTWQAPAGIGFDALVAGGSAPRQAPASVREVHDPAHPMADAQGMVRYPDVDLVQQMTTLVSASRGYEANVRAFNLLRGMQLRALELGAK